MWKFLTVTDPSDFAVRGDVSQVNNQSQILKKAFFFCSTCRINSYNSLQDQKCLRYRENKKVRVQQLYRQQAQTKQDERLQKPSFLFCMLRVLNSHHASQISCEVWMIFTKAMATALLGKGGFPASYLIR